MSSILRIILTSWVARLICCFLPINVSITCCSFISAKNQGHLNHWDNLKVISIRCGELEGGDYIQSECLFGIRELKQWRQRPGRKRLVKKWIYIILHLSRCLVRLSSSELAQAKYVIPVLKSKWKYEKIADDVRILQNTQNLMISRCCFAKDGKDMWKDSKRTCRTILPIKRFVWWRPHCHSFRGLVKLRLRP